MNIALWSLRGAQAGERTRTAGGTDRKRKYWGKGGSFLRFRELLAKGGP
jgi:hypothetical protein